MTFLGLLTLLLVALKALGYITIPWVIVFVPVLLPLLGVLFVMLIAFIYNIGK